MICNPLSNISKIVFKYRFDEFGSLLFILPAFIIVILHNSIETIYSNPEKICLVIALILLLIIPVLPNKYLKIRLLIILRDFAPIFFVLVIYSNLSWIIMVFNPADADNVLIKIDQMLLGMQLSVTLEKLLFEPLISFATISYSTYYFIPSLLGLIFYIRGKYTFFRKYISAMMLSFFIGYIGYLIAPAIGPRYTLADQYSVEIEGSQFSQIVRDNINSVEYTKRDCFPSLHNTTILLTLLFAFKRERWFAWIFLPFALGQFFATVYLRYHYFIDVIVGWALAMFCYFIGPIVYRYWEKKREQYCYKITAI